MLRIVPTYLDELTLYLPDPERPGQWYAQRSGDKVPWADRPRSSIAYEFEIPARDDVICYLRLKTTSSSLLYAQALLPRAAYHADLMMYYWQFLFFAVMLMALIWAIYDYFINREQVVAWFILAQTLYLVYVFCILGYAAPLVPNENWFDFGTSVSVCLMTTSTLIFHHQLLATFRPPGWFLRILKIVILAFLLVFAMLWMGEIQRALFWNGVLALLGSLLFLPIAMLAKEDAPPGLRVLRIYYALLTAYVLIVLLPIIGLFPATEINLYGTLIHGALLASIKFGLLIQRSRALQLQGARATLNLALTEHQLDFERQRLDEQQRLVAMLTHELKTPLATARLSVDRLQMSGTVAARITRALEDMDGIVERCRQSDQFDHKALSGEWRILNLGQITADVIAASGQTRRIRFAKPGTEIVLTSDPLLLAIVLSNLVDNALKYSAADSLVHVAIAANVSADERHGYCVLVDNEPGLYGVPDGERVFEKYYRGPATHGKIGSGLGLYLARGLAQQLGGALEHQFNSPNIRFIFWIPSCK